MGFKIGLDIDGVVADSFPVFIAELNKHYGKNVTEIDDYDIAKVYGVPWDDMDSFFNENMEYLFSTPEPMAGALETIRYFQDKGNEIFFVTARRCGGEERVTLDWFERHGIPRDKAIFAGGASKTFAVRELGINVFVEDFMSNALEIASIGVPVLLLDTPYNQGKTPKGVTRCYNWREIKELIEEIQQRKVSQNY
ncbi:MAG: hypothetical protein GX434_10980 [Peptococcaceae bacterium]|nr:hypothetical protein [Peptococcaceae bacterium]